jgi:uncharacterized membrane protein YkvA (DUF1232 family)
MLVRIENGVEESKTGDEEDDSDGEQPEHHFASQRGIAHEAARRVDRKRRGPQRFFVGRVVAHNPAMLGERLRARKIDIVQIGFSSNGGAAFIALMAKAKKKKTTAAAKRKAATKAPPKTGGSLQARLETEFSEALKSAKTYITQPERLRDLVREAASKAASMPKEPFKESWAYFQAMLRLIRAYYRGEYREVAATTLVVIVAAIIYVVNPFDLIPDWVPGLGLLDDAFILGLAIRRTRQSLDDFMTWETSSA